MDDAEGHRLNLLGSQFVPILVSPSILFCEVLVHGYSNCALYSYVTSFRHLLAALAYP
jgi:hypothetical protein